MENKKHYAGAILAFVIWGFFSIPLRALKEYSAGEVLFFRILFSLAIIIVIVAAFKRNELTATVRQVTDLPTGERNRVIILILAGAVLLTVNWLSFIYVVNYINVKTASFSYLICPVITAVLGFVMIGEKLSTLQWTAVLMCAVSCVLIGMNSALELGYSVLTAFTYAMYLISQRRNQGFDRIVILGFQILFSFVILSLISDYLVSTIPTDLDFYLIILVIAAVFTVLPLFLNLFALNKINAATIGILMYINPLFNFTVAFLVFHESASALQLTGYVIIIAALVLFNYPNFKKLQSVIRA